MTARPSLRSPTPRVSIAREGACHGTKWTGVGGKCHRGNCSFVIPGLGQLVQGRLLIAVIMFLLAGLLWIVWLGWLIHLWSILDAALWKRR